jgi:hypothetical protein
LRKNASHVAREGRLERILGKGLRAREVEGKGRRETRVITCTVYEVYDTAHRFVGEAVFVAIHL